MTESSAHLKGLLLTVSGVVILSPDALLIRLLDLDVRTLIFWRGLGIALVVSAVVAVRYRRRFFRAFWNLGAEGCVLAISFAMSTALFVTGISNTEVANVLIIVASAPLFAAFFSWLLSGERLGKATLIAILVGMVGVIVTASEAAGTGGLRGNLAATGCAAALGFNFAILRSSRGRDMLPAYALGGAFLVLIGALAAPTLAVASTKLLYLAILCGFIQPVSFMLIMIGPRYLPAAEASLVMLLETVLGPIWVWAFLGDIPSGRAWIGGAIIIAAIIGHSLVRLRQPVAVRAAQLEQTS